MQENIEKYFDVIGCFGYKSSYHIGELNVPTIDGITTHDLYKGDGCNTDPNKWLSVTTSYDERENAISISARTMPRERALIELYLAAVEDEQPKRNVNFSFPYKYFADAFKLIEEMAKDDFQILFEMEKSGTPSNIDFHASLDCLENRANRKLREKETICFER